LIFSAFFSRSSALLAFSVGSIIRIALTKPSGNSRLIILFKDILSPTPLFHAPYLNNWHFMAQVRSFNSRSRPFGLLAPKVRTPNGPHRGCMSAKNGV
jgi:hypothetical protein